MSTWTQSILAMFRNVRNTLISQNIVWFFAIFLAKHNIKSALALMWYAYLSYFHATLGQKTRAEAAKKSNV